MLIGGFDHSDDPDIWDRLLNGLFGGSRKGGAMNEVECDKTQQGRPCYECPYCRRRRWWSWWRPFSGGLCAHPLMLHPVTGATYQSCERVRRLDTGHGGRSIDNHFLVCSGYFPDEHAVRWR